MNADRVMQNRMLGRRILWCSGFILLGLRSLQGASPGPDGGPAPTSSKGWEWTVLSDAAGGAKGAAVLKDGRILATRTDLTESARKVIVSESLDHGTTWKDLATICEAGPDIDLGDGHLIQTRAGNLLYSYRENRFTGIHAPERSYAIRVAQSTNGGTEWKWHSDVATSCAQGLERKLSGGLWSSFLLERADGTLQCYYDDEWTPLVQGKANHQWVSMKTWNAAANAWTDPVTVARAVRQGDLSRDGMATVVETSAGQLLAVLESVAADPPHPNILRVVRSTDGGATWSWANGQDNLFYAAQGTRRMAMAPWLARQANGRIFCVFVTDEDASEPSVPGGNPSLMKIRLRGMFSDDAGKTWSLPIKIEPRDQHAYLPGVLALPDGEWRVLYTSADLKSYVCLRGFFAP